MEPIQEMYRLLFIGVRMKIDVIIPVYGPGRELLELLDRLEKQTLRPSQIILMNTEKELLERTVSERTLLERYDNLQIYHLSKQEFDHGGTRKEAVYNSDADVFVCLTQDALPADTRLLEHLTEHLEGRVAVAYGRQLPRRNSGVLECISREFNYPGTSLLKGSEDLERLGIKTFFCSNVCAAYRRDVYEELGGFENKTIFNEDMIYAAKAVKSGWKVAYEAKAKVYHSHNYTCMQQFHRNFDLGVSQACHPEVFGGIRSESEGKKLVKTTLQALLKKGRPEMIPYFFAQSCFKYAGYLLGKNYRKLPKFLILWASDNKSYWRNVSGM